jgi:hypothetical protein
MGGRLEDEKLIIKAFGDRCVLSPKAVQLGDEEQTGPLGIILSLYALHASEQALVLEPLKAFKEFPNSMPYIGAFASHTEQILTASVGQIIENRNLIMNDMDGSDAPAHVSGDSAMVLHPLPKLSLCYIFYQADEDFPAAATCLFSNNANTHMPMDGLADVGEYTSRRILDLIKDI